MYSKSEIWTDERRALKAFVLSKIEWLQDGYLRSPKSPNAVRSLSVLRRSSGLVPGVVPETWSIELGDMPDSLIGSGDSPSAAEAAAHAALVLYAIHQQSQNRPMHVQGCGLGGAVRALEQAGMQEPVIDIEPPSRFKALVTSESFEESVHYLRQIVQQLKAQSIPLDYGMVADDLFGLLTYGRAEKVKLAWARDFVKRTNQSHGETPAE